MCQIRKILHKPNLQISMLHFWSLKTAKHCQVELANLIAVPLLYCIVTQHMLCFVCFMILFLWFLFTGWQAGEEEKEDWACQAQDAVQQTLR